MIPWDSDAKMSAMLSLRDSIVRKCSGCGGKGYVVQRKIDSETGLPRRVRHTCYRKLVRHIELLDAGVPSGFWSSHKLLNDDQYSDVVRYISKIDVAHRRGFGLILSGPNGCGKTTAACAILIAAKSKGLSIAYAVLQDLLSSKSEYKAAEAASDWYESVVGAEFVVLDELGKESWRNEQAKQSRVEAFLRHRWSTHKPTIVCTNLELSEIKERKLYTLSVIHMLAARSRSLSMEAVNFRISERDAIDEEIFG